MEPVAIPSLFLVLAAMLVAAKLLGELAERFGQPAVLGELIAGVLLGGSVLGIVPTAGTGAEEVSAARPMAVATKRTRFSFIKIGRAHV